MSNDQKGKCTFLGFQKSVENVPQPVSIVMGRNLRSHKPATDTELSEDITKEEENSAPLKETETEETPSSS